MELVSVVEHRMKSNREENEMRTPEHWRVEIFVVDDVLDWKLILVRDGEDYVADNGWAYTASDAMFDARKCLEGYLPEMFS